jgi:hypothetical protein
MEKCRKHPRYGAKRPPRGCPSCKRIFNAKRKAVAKATQGLIRAARSWAALSATDHPFEIAEKRVVRLEKAVSHYNAVSR